MPQRYSWGRGRVPLDGGGVYCAQAGVDAKSHHDKRMKIRLVVLFLSCPIRDSVETLCYRHCGLTPTATRPREKTRTIIVADHPPDPAQRWDFANWVKWLDGETGQGSFVVFGNFFVCRFFRSPTNLSEEHLRLNDEST